MLDWLGYAQCCCYRFLLSVCVPMCVCLLDCVYVGAFEKVCMCLSDCLSMACVCGCVCVVGIIRYLYFEESRGKTLLTHPIIKGQHLWVTILTTIICHLMRERGRERERVFECMYVCVCLCV